MSEGWFTIEECGVLKQDVAYIIKALDDLGVTPEEAKRGAERSRAKDLRIAELEIALSGRTYCHSDDLVEQRCVELEKTIGFRDCQINALKQIIAELEEVL